MVAVFACALFGANKVLASDYDSLTIIHKYYIPINANYAGGPGSVPTWDWGVGFLYQLPQSDLRLGVTNVSYTQANLITGDRHALGFAPSLEYAQRLTHVTEVVGGIALPLQWRWGADMNTLLGISPEVRAGMDFYFQRYAAIGIETRWSYVLTDGYLRSPRVIPNSAVIGSVGLALKFRFGITY